jgi:hypothetical protein
MVNRARLYKGIDNKECWRWFIKEVNTPLTVRAITLPNPLGKCAAGISDPEAPSMGPMGTVGQGQCFMCRDMSQPRPGLK